ncbi:MAG: hypothetical protein ATN35_04475 [Epulopiscium sp. Nele67-Bin004]|nr:MAG: hypothetical protein ATN35_04475 [Epulopiscium sp. Nele67-Bin004]
MRKMFDNKYGQAILISYVVLIAFLGITLSNTYNNINFLARGNANFMFFKTAVSTFDTAYDTELFAKTYVDDVIGLVVKSPLSYIHQTLPFAQNLPIVLSSNGIVGVFDVPDAHELINLDKENTYEPQFSEYIPVEFLEVKQELDVVNLADPGYLLQNIFIGDKDLNVNAEVVGLWDFVELAERELSINTNVDGPQVLIFHTHNRETYVDEDFSNAGSWDTGVVLFGATLKQVLEERYGLEVLHVNESFYSVGKIGTDGGEYDRGEIIMQKIIDDNPSLQIAIDIHRDELATTLVGEVNGQDTAKLMFVNGISMKRDLANNLVPMQYLTNPNLEDNLAFSIQAQMAGLTYYPEITRKIYLKTYRYSTNMLPYSMLLEVGANTNTIEQALNAVEPFADILAIIFGWE